MSTAKFQAPNGEALRVAACHAQSFCTAISGAAERFKALTCARLSIADCSIALESAVQLHHSASALQARLRNTELLCGAKDCSATPILPPPVGVGVGVEVVGVAGIGRPPNLSSSSKS
jgi:hypothetical protein